MKCQKCGINEANVSYTQTVNGETAQICLCGDCARETGLLEKTDSVFREMEREMLSAFAMPFGNSFFARSLPRGFADVFGALPEISLPEEAKEKKDNEPREKEKFMNREDALKAQLLDAIAEERYEDAAKLRDEIKEMEKK